MMYPQVNEINSINMKSENHFGQKDNNYNRPAIEDWIKLKNNNNFKKFSVELAS